MAESIDFSFDEISAAEHDRLQALYAPLTQAVRDLIEAGIRSGADEATIRDAQLWSNRPLRSSGAPQTAR